MFLIPILLSFDWEEWLYSATERTRFPSADILNPQSAQCDLSFGFIEQIENWVTRKSICFNFILFLPSMLIRWLHVVLLFKNKPTFNVCFSFPLFRYQCQCPVHVLPYMAAMRHLGADPPGRSEVTLFVATSEEATIQTRRLWALPSTSDHQRFMHTESIRVPGWTPDHRGGWRLLKERLNIK